MTLCDRIKARGSPKMALLTRNVLRRMYDSLSLASLPKAIRRLPWSRASSPKRVELVFFLPLKSG